MKEDRQAFKNRMRSLRTYREQNPGKGYWEWKRAIQDYKGIDVDNDPTYDYYGFYKENPKAAEGILNNSRDAHFTDTYKTSVHPTFSNESKYSGYSNKYNPKGIVGGYWGKDNSYNFSDSQIKNNWDVHSTLRYLEDAENYGVTAKYKGMYPKDTDNIIYGGVLPQVEVKAQSFDNSTDAETFKSGGPVKSFGVGMNILGLLKQIFDKDERSLPVARTMYHVAHNSQVDPGLGLSIAPDAYVGADVFFNETLTDPGEVFFLSPENQKKEISKNKDYRVIDTTSEEDPYGVVRTAANYHKQKHNEVPVYEYIANSDTTVNKDNLIPILTRDNKQLQVPYLPHAGSYNSVLYVDKNTGNYYQRAYDLNDYGPSSSGNKGTASSYPKLIKWLTEKMDEMGTPFVQRTGFVPTPETVYYYLSEEERELVDKTKKSLGLYKDGGEVEPPYPQFVNGQRVNRWTGQPIATGQATPVFDLRDAADFTPAGDVLAAKDTYEAIQDNDWIKAGLAAAGILPIVPNIARKIYRETPTVNKNYVSDAIEALDQWRYNRNSAEAAMNNETYEIIQRLMDDPSYMRRANEVKYRYGDDYISTYADLINAYNYSPELLPKAKVTKFDDSRRAQMIAKPEAANRHRQGGEFPTLGEYEYRFDPDNAVEGMTLHELDHQVDFLKNKVPDADGNSNMFYRMRQSLKPYSDGMSKYYSNPTEQKAYMNQLREFMYNRGMIKTRDEQVTKEMLQEAMNKLPKSMSSIINASKQFKSMRAYTKWFNQIPLLTAGVLGINRYYNQQQEQ